MKMLFKIVRMRKFMYGFYFFAFASSGWGQEATGIQDITVHSAALHRNVTYTIVKPRSEPPPGGYPVVVILHGLGRDHRTLIANEETRRLLMSRRYMVLLPDSGTGWWIDSPFSGDKYESMLIEVVEAAKHRSDVSQRSEDWAILGWSMGGFGAMHFAENHPNEFGFAGSIIGLLDYPRYDGLPADQRFKIDKSVFGNDRDFWATLNPCDKVNNLHRMTISLVIANGAFDRTMNEDFLKRARHAGIKPEVHRIEGEHIFSTVVKGLSILLPRIETYFSQNVSASGPGEP